MRNELREIQVEEELSKTYLSTIQLSTTYLSIATELKTTQKFSGKKSAYRNSA